MWLCRDVQYLVSTRSRLEHILSTAFLFLLPPFFMLSACCAVGPAFIGVSALLHIRGLYLCSNQSDGRSVMLSTSLSFDTQCSFWLSLCLSLSLPPTSWVCQTPAVGNTISTAGKIASFCVGAWRCICPTQPGGWVSRPCTFGQKWEESYLKHIRSRP